MLAIHEADNQSNWNEFLCSQERTQLLQSYEWGELQKKLNHKITRLAFYNSEQKMNGCGLFIQQSLPLSKSYLYCPRGVILNENLNESSWNELLQYITKLDIAPKAIFLRFDPSLNMPTVDNGYVVASTQPASELFVKLNISESNLLNHMSSKARYNINLSQRHNISVITSNEPLENLDIFYKLILSSGQRNKFRIYTKKYYGQIIQTLTNNKNKYGTDLKMFVAQQNKNILATALIAFFGDTATYLHGGFDFSKRNLMAPYLLHWEIMKHSKNLSYKYYNFGGVSKNTPNHELKLQSLTKFKTGFVSLNQGEQNTGLSIDYPPSFDIIYNKYWYNIYKLVRPINKVFQRMTH